MPIEITRDHARRLMLRAQGLDGGFMPQEGPLGTVQTISRLGYVQIDTIAVVERAHHHTLWSRQPDYQPDHLHQALARQRAVFEYWYPAASYVPIEHYRFCLPSMRSEAEDPSRSEWMSANSREIEMVLARIRQEGPLGSADFEAPPGFERGTWWTWKPARIALDHLFSTGELMVTERRNFQRLYDLPERVLPSHVDTSVPSDEELARFLAEQALNTLGVAGEGNTRWRGKQRSLLGRGLRALTESGEAVAVRVEGAPRAGWFMRPRDLDSVPAAEGRRMHILSPFDSLVIHRDWLKALFDYEYTLECYVSPGKRRYGYFCLPILWGDQFIARMDAKADRGENALYVHRIEFEPGVTLDQETSSALAHGIWRFAAFNGCSSVLLGIVAPDAAGAPLAQALQTQDPSASL